MIGRSWLVPRLFAVSFALAASPVLAADPAPAPVDPAAAVPGGADNVFRDNIGVFDRFLPPPVYKFSADGQLAQAADGFPPGLSSHESPLGHVVTDPHGKTLYAMLQGAAGSRVSNYAAGNPGRFKYCIGPCAEKWIAYAAPADAKPIGKWTIVTGAQGPQWAFAGQAVFTYADDQKPGDVKGHEFDDMWVAIMYVPVPPHGDKPPEAKIAFANDAYLFTDNAGHPLIAFRGKKDCAKACEGATPLYAGLASRDLGPWTVLGEAGRSQWAYQKKLVFAAKSTSLDDLPGDAIVLRP